ncbi:hypothetical protein C8Q78DRAFT_800514 [Trametes maxima]|nr:hypothetical protein C8Q78DRAFT_800514 [Trametes maxima]
MRRSRIPYLAIKDNGIRLFCEVGEGEEVVVRNAGPTVDDDNGGARPVLQTTKKLVVRLVCLQRGERGEQRRQGLCFDVGFVNIPDYSLPHSHGFGLWPPHSIFNAANIALWLNQHQGNTSLSMSQRKYSYSGHDHPELLSLPQEIETLLVLVEESVHYRLKSGPK